MLKADLHIHANEDFLDRPFIKYSAKDIILHARRQNFDVLSITLHGQVLFNKSLKDYAKKKGILLIPGAEPRIEGKDVLLLNVTQDEVNKLTRLDMLEQVKDSALVIAPHPYFHMANCLGKELEPRIGSFDAIEYSHFYSRLTGVPGLRFTNGNLKAEWIAHKYKKPLIGTSDAHKFYEFGLTYSMIDSQKNNDSVIEAIKKSRLRIVSRPMSTHNFIRRGVGAVVETAMQKMRRDINPENLARHIKTFK